MVKIIIPTTTMDIYIINKNIQKIIILILENIFHIFLENVFVTFFNPNNITFH